MTKDFYPRFVTPTVSGKHVYVTLGYNIIALDAMSGEVRWNYVFLEPQQGSPAEGGRVEIKDGMLFVGTRFYVAAFTQ